MKTFDLSFGTVTLLRKDLAEVIINQGVEMDLDIVDEYHMFIVTNVELYETYKLKVSGPRLSDQSHTSAKIQAELESDDVARRMIEANGDYFYWD